MPVLNWDKVRREKAASNGLLCVVDETEYQKGDAAARWLERNDKPKRKFKARRPRKSSKAKQPEAAHASQPKETA